MMGVSTFCGDKTELESSVTRRQECLRYVAQVFNLRVLATFQSPDQSSDRMYLISAATSFVDSLTPNFGISPLTPSRIMDLMR